MILLLLFGFVGLFLQVTVCFKSLYLLSLCNKPPCVQF